jgi:hypothetical protein
MTIAIAALSRLLSPLWMPIAHAAWRVTRLAEAHLPRHLAGRMVISGTFDDVCRELERLEAMGHEHTH